MKITLADLCLCQYYCRFCVEAFFRVVSDESSAERRFADHKKSESSETNRWTSTSRHKNLLWILREDKSFLENLVKDNNKYDVSCRSQSMSDAQKAAVQYK